MPLKEKHVRKKNEQMLEGYRKAVQNLAGREPSSQEMRDMEQTMIKIARKVDQKPARPVEKKHLVLDPETGERQIKKIERRD